MPATKPPTHHAWRRAVNAQQALQASEHAGADRLSESAFRLSRAHERLNESERRVSRGKNRQHAPAGPASIAARPSSGKLPKLAPVGRPAESET